MSASREHRRRAIERERYREEYRRWMARKPSFWQFRKYFRWRKERPVKPRCFK